MADGDPSLDGGYLGMKIAQCYERLEKFGAAKYWYGRAVEENIARDNCFDALQKLENVNINDLISPEDLVLYQQNES